MRNSSIISLAVLLILVGVFSSCSMPATVSEPSSTSPQKNRTLLKTPTQIPTPTLSLAPTYTPVGGVAGFGKLYLDYSPIRIYESLEENIVRLTDDPQYVTSFAWSPDGTEIAFVSFRDILDDIYLLNLEGGDITRLTEGHFLGATDLTWLSDENRIAFARSQFFYSDEGSISAFVKRIYSFNVDVAREQVLDESDVEMLPIPGLDIIMSPIWSPDEKTIAFATGELLNDQIYLMDSDGSNLRKLTNDRYDYIPLAWSPDGEWLFFSSNRHEETQHSCLRYPCRWDLFAINIASGYIVALTNDPHGYGSISFSPDGRFMALTSSAFNPDYAPCGNDCGWNIFIISSGSMEVVALTADEYDYSALAWSPDGKKLAFVSDRGEGFEIYMIDVSWLYD